MPTEYSPIASADKAAGAPVSTTLINALDFNVQALAEGNAPFPIVPEAIGGYVAGDYPVATASSGSSGALPLIKVREIRIPGDGTIRTSISSSELVGGATWTYRVYINGTAVGITRSRSGFDDPAIWDEDFTVVAGDLVQLYAATTDFFDPVRWDWFKIKVANPVDFSVTL